MNSIIGRTTRFGLSGVLAVLSSVCPIACTQPGSPPAQEVTEYRFTDASDGVVGGIDFGAGDHVLFYGALQSDGTLTRLDAITMLDSDGAFHEVYFDESGLPVRMRTAGYTWELAWQESPGATPVVTITVDGQDYDIELGPDAADLLDVLHGDEPSAEFAAREFNRTTLLGAAQMGLGLAGFVAGTAAVSAGLVASAPLTVVGGLLTLAGAAASYAGGANTIALSATNETPTPDQQRVFSALSNLSLTLNVAGSVGVGANITRGLAVAVADRLAVLGLAADLAELNESELAAATRAAQTQACANNPDCANGGNTGTTTDACCVATNNCPSEEPDDCTGDCCCCGLGSVCVNNACSSAFGKPAPAAALLLGADGPELKRALAQRIPD